jgi:hypothetical protein
MKKFALAFALMAVACTQSFAAASTKPATTPASPSAAAAAPAPIATDAGAVSKTEPKVIPSHKHHKPAQKLAPTTAAATPAATPPGAAK